MLVCKPMAVVCKRTVGLQMNAKCLQNKVSFQIIRNNDATINYQKKERRLLHMAKAELEGRYDYGYGT